MFLSPICGELDAVLLQMTIPLHVSIALIPLCYAVALFTSAVFVRWILPEARRAELGSGNRFVAIDGIRGFLAFGVFVHHCGIMWGYSQTGMWSEPGHNFQNQLGKTSVAVFFMITSFLFWGRVVAKNGLDYRQFFISRFFRIYPLYVFVTLVICVAVGFKTGWHLQEPLHRLMLEVVKWLGFRTPDINNYIGTPLIVAGVTWTLLYEAWFYVSLPFLTAIFLGKRANWQKLLCVLAVVVFFRLNHLSPSIAATFLGGVAAVYWRQKRTQNRNRAKHLVYFLGARVPGW